MNWNVLVDLVSLFVILSIRLFGMKLNRLFNAMSFCISLIFILDSVAWLADGTCIRGVGAALWTVNTTYYMLQITYCYLWFLFAVGWTYRKYNFSKRKYLVCAIPMFMELVLISSNYWTGWIFEVNETNIYSRGCYFYWNLIPYYLYIVGAIVMALHGLNTTNGKRRRQSIAFLIFMFLPVCGTLIETFTYGVSWIWPFTALSLLMVYLDEQQRMMNEEKIASIKREQENRIATMLSQIQPHFLYNSLNTIYYLCAKDSNKAQEAIAMFSDYLRYNMNTTIQKHPIPFSKELMHVRTYLELEKMRFEEMLLIVWDIRTEDFVIPALTLQPLVENAVKHGVGKKENGGKITISTREEGERILIVVEDDGVGFCDEEDTQGKHLHIGIENVRERLKLISNATLKITSEYQKGTKVVICLPKR